MWVTGGFERYQCQIKFVTKKGKTFIYLVTIRYSAADYLEMIIIFEECGPNARGQRSFFRLQHIFNFLLQHVIIIIHNIRNDRECHLIATIKYQPLPYESEARGRSKTKLQSATDPSSSYQPKIIVGFCHMVLRIRASVTDLLSDPTLVAQLRSVESLRSNDLLESPVGFALPEGILICGGMTVVTFQMTPSVT
jgi:hypothetical protein